MPLKRLVVDYLPCVQGRYLPCAPFVIPWSFAVTIVIIKYSCCIHISEYIMLFACSAVCICAQVKSHANESSKSLLSTKNSDNNSKKPSHHIFNRKKIKLWSIPCDILFSLHISFVCVWIHTLMIQWPLFPFLFVVRRF
jgi:hypothetical protein